MNELIRHERESLRDNYAAYLTALELRGEPVPFESDRLYVELLRRADELPDIRNSCVSALRSFKNAGRTDQAQDDCIPGFADAGKLKCR